MFSKPQWWNVHDPVSEPYRLLPLGSMLVLATAFVVGLSGCADDASGEFRAYSELPSEESTDARPVVEPVDQAAEPEESAADSQSEATAGAAVGERAPVEAQTPVAPESAVEVATVSNSESSTPAVDKTATSADLTNALALVAKPLTPQDEQPAPFREVKVLVEDREFKTEGPEGALRISYDDFDLLKILNMDPVTPDAPHLLPDWLRDLDGKRIRVRGFMYPPFQETGIVVFVLARDNQICCFGRDPKVYDLVKVTMRKGSSTNYIQNRPFDVMGTFHIRPDVVDDTVYGLYEIDDALVID